MTDGPTGHDLQPARIDPIRAGLLCRCPRCDKGGLFAGFLKVTNRCEACGFDFTRLNTGDGAAIFIMQIAGGIVVFGALFIQVAYNPPIWAMLLVAMPLTVALSVGLMRPGKGVMIALQMRNMRPSPVAGDGLRSDDGGELLTSAILHRPAHHTTGVPPRLMGEV